MPGEGFVEAMVGASMQAGAFGRVEAVQQLAENVRAGLYGQLTQQAGAEVGAVLKAKW